MFRKLIKLLSQRAAITALSFLLQVALAVFCVVYATQQFVWAYAVLELCSFFTCLYIISRDINPAYKLSWCVLLLAMPLFGGPVYLFIGRQRTPRRLRKRFGRASDVSQALLNSINAEHISERGVLNPTGTTCADLVLNAGSYPVYGNTQTTYYPLGDLFFPAMLDDIRSARRFIFFEYFIYERGSVWDEIEAALIERARAGVEVKLIYDDVGSMFTLPKTGIKRLRDGGVSVLPFNKISLSFDIRLNNRSHRKITVIDGEIAYTGGNNIADEYANRTERLGHWKDTQMRFVGSAARSFTVMFLSFWSILDAAPIEYDRYAPSPKCADGERSAVGYVQPLSSGPGRDDGLIENAFINMISTAKRYVYITTPYLILDSEMQTALVNAALAGVDVRIIIPKRPDKRIVYKTTKSFVPILVKAGVRVYTYTPGFIHAKMLIVDDERAFIGTCNMDYRSFYLHYEDGALLYNTDSIVDMKSDYCSTLELCDEMTDINNVRPATRFVRSVLRLIAPML